MTRALPHLRALAALGAAGLLLAACGGSDDGDAVATDAAPAAGADSTDEPAGDGDTAASGDVPAWCGPEEITLGFTDGFGGNSWRLVTTESGRDEAAKCPSVTEFLYADGQGDTQKAISDIQGMVAQGVDALVVFPDAGEAMLPALRSAFEAGVVTVPYRVDPGGEDGVDYTAFIALDNENDGQNYAAGIQELLPDGGNVLFLGGPAGNSQSTQAAEAMQAALDPELYTFIGEQPFEVTNWDPALAQQVLTAAIARYDDIDVIVSDFGPSLVGALPEFENAGRTIPPLVTSDGNVLGCFWEENQEANEGFELFTIATGNDHVRTAMQYAIAQATGGEVPESTAHQHALFENSVTGDPNEVQCEPDLPGDIYLSAELPAEEQAALLE
ncbi:substrate-binding domain-containing protein [Aquipuribacter nitratireducens]|uniref:Substrate-binding domain-containing protein n=1 Tax=Aquipuribacter nitratireducens TaxID=650104 RepID=A0ABW0GRG2_9MICO